MTRKRSRQPKPLSKCKLFNSLREIKNIATISDKALLEYCTPSEMIQFNICFIPNAYQCELTGCRNHVEYEASKGEEEAIDRQAEGQETEREDTAV